MTSFSHSSHFIQFPQSSNSSGHQINHFLMRRRKNRVYIPRIHSRILPTFARTRSISKAESNSTVPKQRIPRNSARSSASSRPILNSTIHRRDPKALTGAETLRKRLFLASALIAGLNVCSSLAGCYVVGAEGRGERVEAAVYTAICGVSLVLIALLWWYWSLAIHINDAQSAALSVQFVESPELICSPVPLTKCLLECLLHLLVPIPGLNVWQKANIFGIEITVSLNHYLVLAILLRNYHLLRAFYWFSPFSSIRTLIYARITTVSSQGGFLFRCCLAAYKFKLIMLIYGAMVVTGGIVQTILEHETQLNREKAVWSGLWVVAYTQGSIGYGDEAPITFPAQATMIINVMLGSCLMGLLTTIISDAITLDLREYQFYSSILSSRYKRKDVLVIVLVIQSWWRLICSRIRRQPHGPSIIHFYSALRKFRAVLVRCNTIKSGLLQNQVAVFGQNVGNRIRDLNVYLYSIRDAQGLVRAK